jgi:lon-related putative ATP-dependent protease
MKPPTSLSPGQLYTPCEVSEVPYETSDEVKDYERVVGQDRALEAIHFGTRIKGLGYNVFALGPAGTGKHSVVMHILEKEAENRETPSDWCYVYNFKNPDKPNAMQMPPGLGIEFRDDMEQLCEDMNTAIPAAFEAEDYRTQIETLQQELAEKHDQALNELAEDARKEGVKLIHTPSGFAFAPLDSSGTEVIRPERYEKLSETKRKKLEQTVGELQKRLQVVIRHFPAWQKEAREKIKEIDRGIARLVAGHLIGTIKENYTELSEIVAYLQSVEENIVEHVNDFRSDKETPTLFSIAGQSRVAALHRYKVNLIIDHSSTNSAPVIYQDLPTHSNLMGRSEYQSQMGTLVTDFTLIKAGDLHRANGGYLIIDMRHMLLQPFAWEGLKRALRAREIRIEPMERSLGMISTISLDPEPIPLDVKVVLLGDRRLYYLLGRFDPDFPDLFKVAADFEDFMTRDEENCARFSRLIAKIAQDQSLRPIMNEGVARLVEYGARLAGDANKVSTDLRSIGDILREADYWADERGDSMIRRAHVDQAIDQKVFRHDRVRHRIYEEIENGTIIIDTDGEIIGQINGLSVLDLGEFSFGQPSRITATTRLGDGKLIDIERETKLGGKIHTKGVMILSHFLAAHYARDCPFSLSASLVFEQSYGMVDGDSASLAELCALLSALAEIPIKQEFAVTGSVNQHGAVQAIGGVNQKIEGFFDICSKRGLTGRQGVLIPAVNVRSLMLRKDVVEAVAEGTFRIDAVENVDQAIHLLTGVNAGKREPLGRFEEDTVNARVEDKLIHFADLRRNFAGREVSYPGKEDNRGSRK